MITRIDEIDAISFTNLLGSVSALLGMVGSSAIADSGVRYLTT